MAKVATNRLFAYLVVTIVVGGCGAGSSSSPANRAAYEKKVGADETKANAFVASLAAMPFAGRQGYAGAHPDEVRNMMKIPDPALQEKFRGLMLNRR